MMTFADRIPGAVVHLTTMRRLTLLLKLDSGLRKLTNLTKGFSGKKKKRLEKSGQNDPS